MRRPRRLRLLSDEPGYAQVAVAKMDLIKAYPTNERGRDFAVGDIHGHYSILRASLQAIGFDPARDRLFSVGDLVDRGPESHLALNWLRQPWFHAIRGNHEAMACAAAAGTADDVDLHVINGGEWLQAMPEPQRQQIASRLAALPLAIEVNTAQGVVALVHADLPSDDWRMVAEQLTADRMSQRDADMCLWSIARHARRYAGVVQHARAVVHGHVTVPSMEILGNVYFIDTHHSRRPAGQQGHFTFLDLDTLQAQVGPGGSWSRLPSRR